MLGALVVDTTAREKKVSEATTMESGNIELSGKVSRVSTLKSFVYSNFHYFILSLNNNHHHHIAFGNLDLVMWTVAAAARVLS